MAQYIKIENGSKFWYKDKKMTIIHREDGPAIEYASGTKEWWLNGKRHREAGPAYEGATGTKAWYLNGVEYSEEEFKAKMAPAIELTIADIEKLLGKRVKIVAD